MNTRGSKKHIRNGAKSIGCRVFVPGSLTTLSQWENVLIKIYELENVVQYGVCAHHRALWLCKPTEMETSRDWRSNTEIYVVSLVLINH